MKYMMLIYLDETIPNDAEYEQCRRDSTDYAHQLQAEGKLIGAAPLYPTTTATSIRTSEGKRLVTDGPFAETREQLGGFFLVEAQDLDEAIAIASTIPAGRWGTVEVRPMIDIPGLPPLSPARDVDLAGARSTR